MMEDVLKKKRRTKSTGSKKYLKIIGGVFLGWSFWLLMIVLLLRWINPPFTAFTLQEDWEEIGKERYNLRQTWVPYKEIPDHLKLAVVASEDQRFYEHWGLDLSAIDKALEEKERKGRIRGASTITQQVAKNLFLSPARSYFRKGIEAGIAVLIEVMWTKQRILEVYLNTAEFGPGMFGVNAASNFYYGKSASRLTPKEAARMATVLPNPKIIEPVPASEYVQERSHWILKNMEQLSGLAFLPKPLPENEPDSLLYSADSLMIPILNDSIPIINIADSTALKKIESIHPF
ncbi:monofunctional biosynthetic peptidoglycan transglycosylase [Gracilimonas tropica]|uniref:monofunctional biosynthetic peptidoglycan transglycosylase n=1 Tax=Gracilimonas tropica TaxID=454600 RepID=UPI0003653550|nr:monofunctional biosynthetic peptidoglycan transglycosylase [Gracilimonas tropica]